MADEPAAAVEMLEHELDLTKVTVAVLGQNIAHMVDREHGGGVTMMPEDNTVDPRINDVTGEQVGWIKALPPELVGVSGMISVLLGSESANYLSGLANSSTDVDIVFTSNDSGLGFESQTCAHAKIFQASIAIERPAGGGVRQFMFIGSGYTLELNSTTLSTM